jgi:regulator of sirC expression with transglutaminase-like and TPR domain
MQFTEELSENQRTALLALLADEDPAIYHVIRRKLLAYGPETAPWLQPLALSSNPTQRRHAQDILRQFGRSAADDRFLAFCLKESEACDLEQGAWLLAQTQYPDINVDGYRALLDTFADDLRERIDFAGSSRQILGELNRYLYDELGFSGNEKDYYNPENSYLNRVMDRRTGNPINLCLVYMLVARRLGLPVAGVGLPGHFICRYQSSAAEIYIDAFNRGQLLAKADCVQFLVQGNHGVRPEHLAPVPARRLLLRICGNLHQIYVQLERAEEATRFQRYLVALAK